MQIYKITRENTAELQSIAQNALTEAAGSLQFTDCYASNNGVDWETFDESGDVLLEISTPRSPYNYGIVPAWSAENLTIFLFVKS